MEWISERLKEKKEWPLKEITIAKVCNNQITWKNYYYDHLELEQFLNKEIKTKKKLTQEDILRFVVNEKKYQYRNTRVTYVIWPIESEYEYESCIFASINAGNGVDRAFFLGCMNNEKENWFIFF